MILDSLGQHAGTSTSTTNAHDSGATLLPLPRCFDTQTTPSSPSTHRFTPHHSLPGYVRKAGVSPAPVLGSHMYSKNSHSLTRYARKAATAAAAAVYAKKAEASNAAHNEMRPGPVGDDNWRDKAEEDKNSDSGGISCGRVGSGRALLGMLRGMSRSLERPHNNNNSRNIRHEITTTSTKDNTFQPDSNQGNYLPSFVRYHRYKLALCAPDPHPDQKFHL